MMESGAGLGGGFINGHLVPASCYLDIVRAATAVALGQEPNLVPSELRGADMRFLTVPPGRVRSVDALEYAQRMRAVIDAVSYFTRGPSAREAVQLAEDALVTLGIQTGQVSPAPLHDLRFPILILLFDSHAHPTLTANWASSAGVATIEGLVRSLDDAGCDPSVPDVDAQVARLQQLGYRGIKLRLRFSGLTRDQDAYAATLRAASIEKLMISYCTYMHCHVSRYPRHDPPYDLVALIEQPPAMRLVLVLGGDFNLLLDVSLTMMKYQGTARPRPAVPTRAVRPPGVHRHRPPRVRPSLGTEPIRGSHAWTAHGEGRERRIQEHRWIPGAGPVTSSAGNVAGTSEVARRGVSIVVPVYNSADTVPALLQRLRSALRDVHGGFEIVLVDDGSADGSWDALCEHQRAAPDEVVAIQLMRNYGQHNALMCGLNACTRDLIVTIDDDLQNPPEEIPRMLEALKSRHVDVLYGVPPERKHARWRNVGALVVQAFYRLVFRTAITPTSFRVLRRHVAVAICKYDLNYTYVDGLLAWCTDRIGSLEVAHAPRQAGRSGYSLRKLLLLAFNLFANFSLLPLQLVSFMGLIAALAGFSIGGYYLFQYFHSSITVPGFASMIVAVLVLGGARCSPSGSSGSTWGVCTSTSTRSRST